MTSVQRIVACAIAGILWLGALVGKHFWADLDVGAFCAACGAVITALGVHGATTGGAFASGTAIAPASVSLSSTGQGGFIQLRLMAIIAVIALGLSLIAGCATQPDAMQVQMIRNACAVDAGLRPTVNVLLAMPGLAQPEEIAAITAARAVIDPVCANPEGSPQANALAAVTGASATVVGIVTQMQARKAGPK